MTRRLLRPILFAATAIGTAIAPAAAAPSCMHPSLVPSLQVGKSEVCWTEIPGASGYDAVVGLSLAQLGAAEAAFAEANVACLGAPRSSNCVTVPYDPPAGDGFYFVVRANRGNGTGSYGTGCETERPGRDVELAAVAACP